MSPRRVDPKFKKQSQSGLPTWAIAGGIGLLVIVGVVVLFTLQTSVAPSPIGGSSTTASSRTKGDPNAKIELFDYSDFQ